MKIVLLTMSLFFALFLGSRAYADDFGRYSGRSSYSNRAYVYHYDGNRRPYHHTGPDFGPESAPNPCFPYGCGGIEGPFTNPNLDARKPENLTACMYDAAGTLLYEREEKSCSYKYIDQNQTRVERRR